MVFIKDGNGWTFPLFTSPQTHDKQERMQNDERMWGRLSIPIPIQLVFKELLLSKSNCPRESSNLSLITEREKEKMNVS